MWWDSNPLSLCLCKLSWLAALFFLRSQSDSNRPALLSQIFWATTRRPLQAAPETKLKMSTFLYWPRWVSPLAFAPFSIDIFGRRWGNRTPSWSVTNFYTKPLYFTVYYICGESWIRININSKESLEYYQCCFPTRWRFVNLHDQLLPSPHIKF